VFELSSKRSPSSSSKSSPKSPKSLSTNNPLSIGSFFSSLGFGPGAISFLETYFSPKGSLSFKSKSSTLLYLLSFYSFSSKSKFQSSSFIAGFSSYFFFSDSSSSSSYSFS